MKTCHSLASQGKKAVVKQGKKFTVSLIYRQKNRKELTSK